MFLGALCHWLCPHPVPTKNHGLQPGSVFCAVEQGGEKQNNSQTCT